MSHVHARKHVELPVRDTYAQWTRFESYPLFMDGIEEVEKITDTELRFRGFIGDMEREWRARIIDQVPDRVISWESIDGPQNGGTVRFHPEDDGTRIDLELRFEPSSFRETDVTSLFENRVRQDLDNFKEHVESVPDGSWRRATQGLRTH